MRIPWLAEAVLAVLLLPNDVWCRRVMFPGCLVLFDLSFAPFATVQYFGTPDIRVSLSAPSLSSHFGLARCCKSLLSAPPCQLHESALPNYLSVTRTLTPDKFSML